MALSGLLGGRSSDIIISGADEFQDAEPVTEGIVHHSDATPRERLNVAFKFGPGRQRAVDRSFNILDLKIEVHRRPVAPIIARQRNLRRGGASRWLDQEVHVRRRPGHLGHRAAEKAPPETKAKRALVESYALLKIVDIYVNQNLQLPEPFCVVEASEILPLFMP
jgi:hypothetical protein